MGLGRHQNDGDGTPDTTLTQTYSTQTHGQLLSRERLGMGLNKQEHRANQEPHERFRVTSPSCHFAAAAAGAVVGAGAGAGGLRAITSLKSGS